MVYYQQQLNMLRKRFSNKIIDICCRMISTDGEVTLEERIWMHKLCEKNASAKEIAEAMLCPDQIQDVDDL